MSTDKNTNETQEIISPISVLHTGLAFGEGPRWRANALYFSDMHAYEVLCYEPQTGATRVVATFDDEPSGLGWLPNGDMLVVAMSSKSLLRVHFDSPETTTPTVSLYADLSNFAAGRCNDMVVTPDGGAYVGNFGYDMHKGEKFATTNLLYVDPEGNVREVADELMFPNGTIISTDGTTLVVAETFGRRLTSYTLGADGSLGNREIWATLPEGSVPDGICLDTDGGIWIASPTSNDCLRIEQGGAVTHRVALDRGAFACMLGGTDLYILAAKSSTPDQCKEQREGQLLKVTAPYAGAGYP